MEFNETAREFIRQSTCGVAPIAGGTSAAPAAPAGSVTGMSNCDPDWAHGYIGTRTQYNFTSEFYMGIDISYSKLFTGFGGTAQLPHQQRPSERPVRHRGPGQRGGHGSASTATSGPDRLKRSQPEQPPAPLPPGVSTFWD